MNRIILLTLVIVFIVIPVSQGQENRLPTCSVAQFAGVDPALQLYHTMLESAQNVQTFQEFLLFGDENILWREDIWSQLPRCTELLEIGLLANQIADGFISLVLLNLAGVPDNNNLGKDQLHQGMGKLESNNAALIQLLNKNESSGDSDLVTRYVDNSLPSCDEAQRQILNDTMRVEYIDLMRQALQVETLDAALAYYEAQVEWRDKLWPQLPPCAEAFDLAVWMDIYASDLAKIPLFDLIGVYRADNPYQERFTQGLQTFSEKLDWLTDTDAKPSETTKSLEPKTYYVSTENQMATLHRCPSQDCTIDAMVPSGVALAVIEDTGDWYIVDVMIGLILYVPSELMSSEPPDE